MIDLCKKYLVYSACLFDSENGFTSYFGDKDIPVRIASVAKLIVGICVFKLIEDNLLDLETDISSYLGYPVRNPNYLEDKITLRMLLNHTSTIIDNEMYNRVNGTNEELLLKDILTANTYSKNKPGEVWQYSNFGFGVIACIIEAVTNTYFTDYLDNEVFKKLGLKASYDVSSFDEVVTLFNETNKFSIDDFARYIKFPLKNNYRGVSGNLFMSINDLSIIALMLKNDGIYNGVRILKPSSLKIMKEVSFKTRQATIALPFEVFNNGVYGLIGGAYGCRTFLVFSKKKASCFYMSGSRIVDTEFEIIKTLIKRMEDFND